MKHSSIKLTEVDAGKVLKQAKRKLTRDAYYCCLCNARKTQDEFVYDEVHKRHSDTCLVCAEEIRVRFREWVITQNAKDDLILEARRKKRAEKKRIAEKKKHISCEDSSND